MAALLSKHKCQIFLKKMISNAFYDASWTVTAVVVWKCQRKRYFYESNNNPTTTTVDWKLANARGDQNDWQSRPSTGTPHVLIQRHLWRHTFVRLPICWKVFVCASMAGVRVELSHALFCVAVFMRRQSNVFVSLIRYLTTKAFERVLQMCTQKRIMYVLQWTQTVAAWQHSYLDSQCWSVLQQNTLIINTVRVASRLLLSFSNSHCTLCDPPWQRGHRGHVWVILSYWYQQKVQSRSFKLTWHRFQCCA